MAIDEVAREHVSSRRDKLIGVYIGVLAVILAVCSMGGGNATKDATLRNIEVSDTWGFFQAKNLRRQAVRLQAEDLEMRLAMEPNMEAGMRKMVSDKIAEYRAQEKRLTSDPEKGEGLDELWAKAKKLEADRDRALQRDPYFDYGQALLQIGIVLASVAIISGGNILLIISAVLGGLGTLLTMGGFTLAFPFPF